MAHTIAASKPILVLKHNQIAAAIRSTEHKEAKPVAYLFEEHRNN